MARSDTRLYLTIYEYGMGAIYTYVEAESADAIIRRYPQLEVLTEPFPWMDEAFLAELRERFQRIGDDAGFLVALDRGQEGK